MNNSSDDSVAGGAGEPMDLQSVRRNLLLLVRARAASKPAPEKGDDAMAENEEETTGLFGIESEAAAEAAPVPEPCLAPEAETPGQSPSSHGEAEAKPEPVEKYSRPPARAELRGEVFDARTARRRWEDSNPVGGLLVAEEARRVFRQPLAEGETEALLNAMIGELHYNMREIAFRSMCHATELDHRMKWIDASIRMAEAGARVAQSVAHLRGAPITTERPRARKRR